MCKNLTRTWSAYNIASRLNIIVTNKIKCCAPNDAIVIKLAGVQSPFDRNVTNVVDPTDERGN